MPARYSDFAGTSPAGFRRGQAPQKRVFSGVSRWAAPYILTVTPGGNAVDIEYCTAEFKSLNDRNNALASGAK